MLGKRGSCSVESERERFQATCLLRPAAGRNAFSRRAGLRVHASRVAGPEREGG